jgi:hypothetical protein
LEDHEKLDKGIKHLPKEKGVYPLEGITEKEGFVWPSQVAAVENGNVASIHMNEK